MNGLEIFGIGPSKEYADRVCKSLAMKRAEHTEEWHDDGEPYNVPSVNVRGRDVFIISSLYNCVKERLADKAINLLWFARQVRDASASRVTLVCPYLAYQRQDRKTESRAPVYTKYFPEMMEGLLRPDDRIITMDAHNLSAYQTGIRIMVDHLEAKPLVADWFVRNIKSFNVDLDNLSAASPDEGGVKRTGFYREKIQEVLGIEMDFAVVYKNRRKKLVKSDGVMGDVKGKDVFLFDDMISSGGTLVKATTEIEKAGGRVRAAVATHGLCVGEANDNMKTLLDKGVRIIVTDTVEPFRLEDDVKKRLDVISTADLFGEAIRCIHNEESISRLMG